MLSLLIIYGMNYDVSYTPTFIWVHPITLKLTTKKVVNHSLINMIWCLTEFHLDQWDEVLNHAEFAYNFTVNQSTNKTPFNIVYTTSPNHIAYMVVQPKLNNKLVKYMASKFI